MKNKYILFVICVILLLSAGCSNSSMLIDGEITESGTTEEYYGGSPDFRLTRMIAENYLMENMEHYDWEGAVIGDFYPLYNPATDKITYLEYKVTKDGADRGYILVTLKDDETGVVESSHGENGTCYELLRDRAGTGEIKAYRFSFASYVAESKTATRAGERKILAALGNIEYELNGAISGGETLSRSRGAVDKYEELIRSYRDRTTENGGYLDIKKEYGEYLKKQNEDTTINPVENGEKSAEIQWYWDETINDTDYDSIKLWASPGSNPNSGIGGTYSIRCYFLNGTYQDITFPLSLNAIVKIPLNRTDLSRIDSIQFGGYMYGDVTVKLYRMKLNNQEQFYSFNSSSIPNYWGILWQYVPTRIHYPLMRARQFDIGGGVMSGCTPTAGTIIAAYWDKMKGIDMYPGTPTAECGVKNILDELLYFYQDFDECVRNFRQHLGMLNCQDGAFISFLGNAFYWYGVERGLSNPCSYECVRGIDGSAYDSPQTGAGLNIYSYDRLLTCLDNDWPAVIDYKEIDEYHAAVIYKTVVNVDSYNCYYNANLSIDTGWWQTETTFTKDIKASTFELREIELIWR